MIVAEQQARDVAVVRLGEMGRGIARRLDRAGQLAAAWDIDRNAFGKAGLSKEVSFERPNTLGRIWAILFVVPGSAEIQSILCGSDGLLGPKNVSRILIDLTTSHPKDTEKLADLAEQSGCDYVDCGMTGGATGADNGTLTLMVGGSKAAIDRCKPIFDVISKQVFHIGGGRGRVIQ